jgi:peptide chain release factor 2
VRAIYTPTGTAALVAGDGDAEATEALALALLRGRLFVERRAATGAGVEAAPPWGSVARAYQLSRRSAVRDPRTGIAHGQPGAVFEGDIDRFIEGYLKKRAAAAGHELTATA